MRPAVLVKGGHGEGDMLIDRLVTREGEVARWEDSRGSTPATPTAPAARSPAPIATGLGLGLPLIEAIARARRFVRAALLAAPGFGAGHGPIGHQAVRGL